MRIRFNPKTKQIRKITVSQPLNKNPVLDGIKLGIISILQLPNSYDFISEISSSNDEFGRKIFGSFFQSNCLEGFETLFSCLGEFSKTLRFQSYLNQSNSQKARSQILGMYSKYEADLAAKDYERLLIILLSNIDVINKIICFVDKIINNDGKIDLRGFLNPSLENQQYDSYFVSSNEIGNKFMQSNQNRLVQSLELLNNQLNEFIFEFKSYYDNVEFRDGQLDEDILSSRLYSNIIDIQLGLRSLYSKLGKKTLEQTKVFSQQELMVMFYLMILLKQEIEVPALMKLTSADGKGATMLTMLTLSLD